MRAVADDTECSSIHWLFCTAEEQARSPSSGSSRARATSSTGTTAATTTFDDFLGALTLRKRKQLRKERAKAQAAIERAALDRRRASSTRSGSTISIGSTARRPTTTAAATTCAPGSSTRSPRRCPTRCAWSRSIAAASAIAGALFLETPQALYGRYWGADAHVDLLHFETAYYAGIDRAIARGLPLFEAGAQGEHKLLRGFEPIPTYSAHWIRHPGLAAAIADYAQREAVAVAAEIAELAKLRAVSTR